MSEETDAARVLDCPVCGEAMEHDSQYGVTVDACDEHGVWLDRGELSSIRLALHSRERRRSRRRVSEARRAGKTAGALFGWWSLLGS